MNLGNNSTVHGFFQLSDKHNWGAIKGQRIALASLLQYLEYQYQRSLNTGKPKYTTILSYLWALEQYHSSNMKPWPERHSIEVKHALKYKLSKVLPTAPPKQDFPVPLELLKAYCSSVNPNDLDAVMVAAITSFCFGGVTRIYEIAVPATHAPMTTACLTADGPDFGIFIPYPKTDRHTAQYCTPRRTGGIECPQKWMSHYLATRPQAYELWISRDGSRMTQKRVIDIFRSATNCPPLGECSFRAGGATYLASQGVPLDEIKLLGRWSSKAWRVYIRGQGRTLQHAIRATLDK